MRYILDNANASFDSATSTWTFDLDRRLSNPRTLRIEKAVFSADTDVDPPPNVVYMRSAALTRMYRAKHRVELTAINHETVSDVVAVLEQQNIQKRFLQDSLTGQNKYVKCMFRMERPEPTHALNPDAHTREIDIY